ncbi:non-hydrolyzing UDP-N-acetylglucosamine 2-epimerase [Sphingomonas sp.]|uniref:non-hydrolyzing UDP-N-acetylglucosamine 2-epimerase n=1 Tax=Sphingomonas sp. TaxID=28214 RepID=UPI002E2F5A35|nr:UDP-N-acetylglucosamine 2-epimerase (non-hydrolyzing) [Sphingomonas sp.]HEX4695448.1 UDP-N-acetylglucosamine 2-epimerase (non-hydrolyzing) [Sphingomonas sp.]
MTILGTRPEIIRLSRVMPALDRLTDHVVVHTGQNYDHELYRIFFDELGLRLPDHSLDASGDTPAETIGKVIIAADKVLAEVKPDAVLLLGDTNSCLAVIPAKRRRIPVFHMEAGNRCFDERVPEEINRRIVDHTADINLPYSSIAREYLLAERLPADRIIKTGSPMFEVLSHYRPGIDASDVHHRLDLERRRYFVVSCHREENVDSDGRIAALADMLGAVAAAYDEPILFSGHPRTRARIEALGVTFDRRVRIMKPFGFLDYNALQLHARAVLSDSGTISEEAAILGFAALNIRDAHERPEAMESAAVMITGVGRQRVLQALEILAQRAGPPMLPAEYAVPDVSEKIVRIILSYTDYVRRTVWKEG